MIIHVDMDAFFASVEQLDAPWLQKRPLVVGGASDRGVVAAASYEARKYGIRSAMPMFLARQKCRDLIIVPPRRDRYQTVSKKVMQVLETISPLVEQVSIDEAYLDITGCQRLLGAPPAIGRQIKTQILQATSLTCSVGIAPLKFLAKIASDLKKPDGLYFIPPEGVDTFLAKLSVGKVPGVGRRSLSKLSKMGIKTLGDLRLMSAAAMTASLGKYGHRLLELAQGIDNTRVEINRPVKSVSSETTLPQDITDRDALNRFILGHSTTVGRQLRKKGFYARTISIKIKFNNFKSHTRSITLSSAIRDTRSIFETARGLMNDFQISRPVRLVGVGASNLCPNPNEVQKGLFDDNGPKCASWHQADQVMDRISERFGRQAITKASLTHRKRP